MIARACALLRPAVCALAGLLAGGCAVYRPAPLGVDRVEEALRPPTRGAVCIEAAKLQHPLLAPVIFRAQDDGLSPEQAAVFAVIANPRLRAVRDARGLARAQIIQAGILPNPQVSPSLDLPFGNSLPGARIAYGFNLNWEVTSLFARGARVESARARAASVDLSVAWQEWQAAQAAKLAVYQLASLRRQIALAREIEGGLAQNARLLGGAVARHDKTETDLAPAQAAAQQAQGDRLLLEQQESSARLLLNQTLGLPPSAHVRLRAHPRWPTAAHARRVAARDLLPGLEERRLDLVALKLGYESQEAALRGAVRAQFPKITLGVTRANDNGNLRSLGPNAVLDLPLFDRNQGNIAIETATRAQLFDDYTGRVFDARADLARASADLRFIAQREESARAALPALERLSAHYASELGEGNVDALVSYGARQSLGAKQLEAEKLRADLAAGVVALELASGLPALTSGGDE